MRKPLVEARRIVIKVGSSLLTAAGRRLDIDYIEQLSAQVASARNQQREIVIVSSGAVVAGMRRLGWQQRPEQRADLQVAAAVGQMGLINAYEDAFSRHNLHAAQVLLTAEDMAHRTLYLNARSTLRCLLKHSVIPVINENDVIATDSISFGDNDRLAAQIANLIEADVLLLLTDVPGLCRNSDTLTDVISEARAADTTLADYTGDRGGMGLGGMRSKLIAAQVAARSGAHSLIMDGHRNDCIDRALSGDETVGTFLVADMPRLSARKQWLASGLYVRGKMILDAGATAAVVSGKRSLLAAGVVQVLGNFVRGDSVLLTDETNQPVGYALVNYDSASASQLCGVKSDAISSVLGFMHEEEMAHRDNMTITR